LMIQLMKEVKNIMRISKRTLFITAIIILMFILIAGCASLFDRVSYYENYVPKGYKDNTVYIYTNDNITLHFRWINENTKVGPYHLFIAVESLNEGIENIYIEDMQITSST